MDEKFRCGTHWSNTSAEMQMPPLKLEGSICGDHAEEQ